MPKGGEGIGKGASQSESPETRGIQVEVVERARLNEYEHQIAGLEKNALDTTLDQSKGGSISERKTALHNILEEMRVSERSGLTLVAKEGEKVVGFISVEKGTHTAEVKNLWMSTNDSEEQQSIIVNLINGALTQLEKGAQSYSKLHIRPVAQSEGFKRYRTFPEHQNRLIIEDAAANDNESSHLEKAA